MSVIFSDDEGKKSWSITTLGEVKFSFPHKSEKIVLMYFSRWDPEWSSRSSRVKLCPYSIYNKDFQIVASQDVPQRQQRTQQLCATQWKKFCSPKSCGFHLWAQILKLPIGLRTGNELEPSATKLHQNSVMVGTCHVAGVPTMMLVWMNCFTFYNDALRYGQWSPLLVAGDQSPTQTTLRKKGEGKRERERDLLEGVSKSPGLDGACGPISNHKGYLLVWVGKTASQSTRFLLHNHWRQFREETLISHLGLSGLLLTQSVCLRGCGPLIGWPMWGRVSPSIDNITRIFWSWGRRRIAQKEWMQGRQKCYTDSVVGIMIPTLQMRRWGPMTSNGKAQMRLWILP